MEKEHGLKLREIRKAEGLTQQEFTALTGIGLSTIKNYEIGREIGLSVIDKVLKIDQFQKYTLWLMIGKTCEMAGQVAPAITHSGREKTE